MALRSIKPATRSLLSDGREREFAVADASREPFRELRGSFFPIGRDELGKSGKQARLSQAIPVDPLQTRLGPGLTEIAERRLLMLVIRTPVQALRPVHHHIHADVE